MVYCFERGKVKKLGNLTFRAGDRALGIIRDGGLRPEMVKVAAGAAGGPKWLVLSQLDRAVFVHWIKRRTEPLYLIGSSIGAWRFAMIARANPLRAIERFEYEYIHQSYTAKPSIHEVTRETLRIRDRILGENGVREILDHPIYRTSILSVRCRRLVGTDNRYVLGFGMGLAAGANLIHRRGLKIFFERTLFSDPRDMPPFFHMTGFPIQKTPLTAANLRQALLASGSIPLVMAGVKDVPGARPGIYRDGAILDYHLDLPLVGEEEAIALFPHFSDRIVPGWFDKALGWRRPSRRNLGHTLVIHPSAEFIARLPHGRIPDREDFHRFKGRDRDRMDCWTAVIEACRPLADEFIDTVESGRIREVVRPLF
jgi:hypothetical protein